MFAVYFMLTGGLAAQPVAADAADPPTQANHHQADFELGSGLAFSFDDGRHEVRIGGFIQPSWGIRAPEGGSVEQVLSARRTHLVLGGEFFDRTAAFFFQTDFSREDPLLDAWLQYSPFPWLQVTFGQRMTVTNNREMLQMESQLAFVDRSLLSRTFSESGREFGLFVQEEFSLGGFLIRPQVAITSGDGRNSFGVDSRDRDIGGLKWGGRLDLLPFGDFEPVNRDTVLDFAHERSFKLVVGGAGSYNDGASHENGAGHGDFALYDAFGELQQPDYILLYGDILAKYQGVSVLVEVANASATSLEGTFTNEAASTPLLPGQISERLVLGNGVNAQLGYYFDFGLSLDVRFTQLFSEFSSVSTSLLQDATAYGGGIAFYLKNHSMKVQLDVERIEIDGAPAITVGDLLVQVIL